MMFVLIRAISDALGLALSHYICDFPGMSLPVGGRIIYTITIFFHITISAYLFFFLLSFPVKFFFFLLLARFQFSLVGV